MSAAESKTQSILAVLAELSSRRVTGTLRFEPEPGSELGLQFLFRKGKLLFATSNYPGERLGEFLVRRGALTEEQASQALLDARQQGSLFHAYLVGAGLIPQEALNELLYQRLEELVDLILRAKDGRFIFRPDLPPEGEEDAPPWVDQELFGRLLLHRNVWPAIFEKMRDPNLILRCHPGIRGSIAFHNLSEGERKLLSLLDGTHTVSRILQARKNRIDLMIVMSRFLESGLIEVVQSSQPTARPALLPSPDDAQPERLVLLEEDSEGPGLMLKEKDQPDAPVLSQQQFAESFFDSGPSPEPLIEPATPSMAEQRGNLVQEDDETAALLEALEGPLLDKAADLLERAEDDTPSPQAAVYPEAEAPTIGSRADDPQNAALSDDEIALMDRALDESLDGDTDALFREVDDLVLREAPPILVPKPQPFIQAQSQIPFNPSQPFAPSSAQPASNAPAAPAQRELRPEPPSTAEEAAAEANLDLDMVPSLQPGIRLAELSITGLMMDDLFLISQVDGKISLRELLVITQMPEAKGRKVIARLIERQYLTLSSRAPRVRLSIEERNKAAAQKLASQLRPAGSAPLEARPEPPPPPLQKRSVAEHAEDLYKRALTSYSENQFAKAEELLRSALSVIPGHPHYRARLAIVLLERPGKDVEAEKLAEDVVEDEPLIGICQEALAFVRLCRGDSTEAKKIMEKATLLDRKQVPSSVAILAALKNYKPKKGDPPDRLWMTMRQYVRLAP